MQSLGRTSFSRFSRFPSLLAKGVQSRSYYTWAEPTDADMVAYPPEDVFRAGVRHHHICNTAWPIAHNTTIRPYRVPRLRDQEDIKRVLSGAFGSLNEMMLYVHIPFCQVRCQFCEYTVVDPKQGKLDPVHNNYVNALLDEFRLYDEVIDSKNKKLVGFDIGGGTPSMPHWKEIDRVMEAAHRHFKLDTDKVEISIETTPKIAAMDAEKVRAYRKMGIKRISMGVQTTDFKQAKSIGREDANASTDYLFKSVDNIRTAGFESFNIDLMYGFPLSKRQADPWLQTVRDTISLSPDHITLYRMRYKGTKMAHLMNTVDLQQVNEQEGAARAALTEAGYSSMVGKNTFSKNGTGCSDYLDKRVVRAVPYVGYGLGAQSFSHHTLQYNLGAVTKRMEQYVKSLELGRIPVQDLYHLSKPAAIAKMASVSFYYGGIDKVAFNEAFETDFEKMFAEEIRFLSEKKLMRWEGNRFQMTMLGKKHFGGVVAQFYSPSVKNHIINLQGGEIFSEDVISKIDKLNAEFNPTARHVQTPVKYEFGNILFGGNCNQKCPFCIGHSLDPSLTPDNLRQWPIKNIDGFISKMRETQTKKIIFTGTRTDPQIYKYQKELVELLRNSLPNVHISLHTNGVNALQKLSVFNLYDSCTISYNSFNPPTYHKLHGTRTMPDLAEIVKNAKMPIKLSCILTQDNKDEVEQYINIARDLGIKRIAFRHVYKSNDRFDIPIFSKSKPAFYHCSNPVYEMDGIQITYWIFDTTSGKSLNLFSDGTLSEEYLLSKAPIQQKSIEALL